MSGQHRALLCDGNQRISLRARFATQIPKSVIFDDKNALLLVCLLLLSMFTFTVSSYRMAGVGDNRSCLIGRLRQCNDDEDCVENAPEPRPQVHVSVVHENETEARHLSSSTILVTDTPQERWGTCTCRHKTTCMRTEHLKQMAVTMEHMTSQDLPKTQGEIMIGSLIASVVFILVAVFAFLIYHYGVRHGLFSYYARQGMRFVNGFSHTEDVGREHQLLNRGGGPAEEELTL